MGNDGVNNSMVPMVRASGPSRVHSSRNESVNAGGGRIAVDTEFSARMQSLQTPPIDLPRSQVSQGSLTNAHRNFEVLVLQNMIETMLPDSAENVFGKGIAGNTWKSMMAEKLAAEVARSSGLGIAERIGSTAPVRANPEVIFTAPSGIIRKP